MKWLLLVTFLLSTAAHTEPLVFATHSLAGQTYTNQQQQLRGTPHGGKRAFAVELVQALMSETNQHYPIQHYPVKRLLKDARSSSPFAGFLIARTPERENHMQWVGPLLTDQVAFYQYVTAENPATYQFDELNQAREVSKICVLNGANHEQFLLHHQFSNMVKANSYQNCLLMLKNNRVDLVIIARFSLLAALRDMDMDKGHLVSVLKLYEIDNYLVFSQGVAKNQVKRWQTALDKLKHTGRYQQLTEQYLYPPALPLP